VESRGAGVRTDEYAVLPHTRYSLWWQKYPASFVAPTGGPGMNLAETTLAST
jgi:hypothetical protein